MSFLLTEIWVEPTANVVNSPLASILPIATSEDDQLTLEDILITELSVNVPFAVNWISSPFPTLKLGAVTDIEVNSASITVIVVLTSYPANSVVIIVLPTLKALKILVVFESNTSILLSETV